MKIRINQECSQKWYRRSSWRRPWWRKIQIKTIERGQLLNTEWTPRGIESTFKITEYSYRTIGVACGPIMLTWRQQ